MQHRGNGVNHYLLRLPVVFEHVLDFRDEGLEA